MIPWHCCWTARIFLSRTRTLAAGKSLGLIRKTSWELLRFSSGGVQRWFPRRALAKIPLASWIIAGFPICVVCDDSVPSGTQIDLRHCGVPSAGFIWRLRLVFSLVIRACILWLKFGPLLCLYPITFLSKGFKSLWFCLLLRMTESSGPTCIKLGQWASTRRDLFSEEFCVQFSKLHIKVTPHPWSYTQYSLGKAFGEGWEKIFTFRSQEPVGSGCVAQVYKAYVNISALGESVQKKLLRNTGLDSALEAWQVSGLKGLFRWFWKRKPEDVSEGHWLHNNHDLCAGIDRNSSPGYPRTPFFSPKKDHLIPVAIKVLHPGLVQQVRMDLFLMKMGSRFAELFPGVCWLSLTEIVEEFEKLMIQQIDLRYEAKNLERFCSNFQGVDYVKFPVPLCPFVTKNILVETFEESKPISQYLQKEVTVEHRQKIAKMGIDMLLKMVFVDNFVHADLHPGNILVQGVESFSDCQDEKITMVDLLDTLVLEVQPSCSPLQLVLLDAGITAELQVHDLENLRAVFTAVILGQGEKVAELILHRSRANKCKDVERFKMEMAELVAEARNNTIALGKLQVGGLLSSVFKLLMTHQVKLESNFASVIFAIMVLEGLGRTLDPELDILKAAKPFLIKPPSSLL